MAENDIDLTENEENYMDAYYNNNNSYKVSSNSQIRLFKKALK